MQLLRVLGLVAAGTAPIDSVPDPLPPAPGDATPTYPDHMPEPGSLTYDTGPAGEGTATGTLSIQPSYALPFTIEFAEADRVDTEQGPAAVYGRATASRRAFSCSWLGISEGERDTLLALFDAAQPFNWTPPGGSAGVYVARNRTADWVKPIPGGYRLGPLDLVELR